MTNNESEMVVFIFSPITIQNSKHTTQIIHHLFTVVHVLQTPPQFPVLILTENL